MDHIAELPEAASPRPLVAPISPRRGAANRIIALHGVSSFCYGLVFPFTGIFLADRPGIGTHGVALYYAVAGVANLAVALVLATGVVRPPRVALGVIGNLLSFAGYLLLPSVGSLSAVGLAAAANGAGQGCFLAAVIPIVNSLVPEADRRQVFARRYQVLNATLALGSLVAGAAISASSRDVIPWLFVVNAIGYLPIAWALLRARTAATASEQAQAAERPPSTAFPVAQLLKASLAVSLFQFGVYLFGYSQFEATAPLVTDKLMHIGLGWISVLIAVNVAVIVTAQKWVTRLLEPSTAGWSAALRGAVCPRRVCLLVFVPSVADLQGARRRADEGERIVELDDGHRLVLRTVHRRRPGRHRQCERRVADARHAVRAGRHHHRAAPSARGNSLRRRRTSANVPYRSKYRRIVER
jgi:Major Facilitator Superfamily